MNLPQSCSRQRRWLPLLMAALWMAACSSEPGPPSSADADVAPFRDVTEAMGLLFTHQNGMQGEYLLPEIVGSGAAWIDYDNDDDVDLFVVQSGSLGVDQSRMDRLFRNDGDRFVDVTEQFSLQANGYGMGVAVADYNNDGWQDIYITQIGPNRLLRNERGERFVDVTAESGTGDPWWSVSATFLDYDRDGWLDLFVADYLDWSPETNQECYRTNGLEDYCGPASYQPLPDRLFRNLGEGGNGRFEDVTASSGIAAAYGAGLGVVSADFNGDGWPDLYVANDGHPNQLWINQADGRFVDDALFGGAALNADGKAEASMGIDIADFDGDGDEDIFMAHLNEETNTLYVNDGHGGFDDRSAALGVGPPSQPFTGFGAGWFDYDNDRQLDLYVVNGAVRTLEDLALEGDPYPLRQRNQLFRQAEGQFVEVVDGLGTTIEVSRGSALGDFDNDGDYDLVIVNSAGPLRLLRNEAGQDNNWIALRIIGPSSAPRDMIGATVRLDLASGETLHRRVRRDGSYASSNDGRLVIGLGDAKGVVNVTVAWPDGTESTFDGLETRRWHLLNR